MHGKLVRYGERGVVNLIVDSIIRQNGSARFLQSIRWVRGSCPIPVDEVTEASWIVKVGLGQFGDPDIILVLKTGKRSYFVFIEAKVTQYQQSAMKNERMLPGYNSSINGQFALKYRFVKALENGWNGISPIVEPSEIHRKYIEALKDSCKRPRRLEKSEVLRLLDAQELREATLDNSFFVALTWDSNPGPFKDPSTPRNLQPLFLAAEGDVTDKIMENVGWVNYSILKKALDLDTEFDSTLSTMVPTIEPTRLNDHVETTITTHNWSQFSKGTLQVAEDIATLSSEYFGKDSVVKRSGSYSVVAESKVVLKIIPTKTSSGEALLFGIRIEVYRRLSAVIGYKGPYLVQGKPFMFHEFRTDNWTTEKTLLRNDLIAISKNIKAI